MLRKASFSPPPATVARLRSTMSVRAASIGRPFRARTTSTRVSSTSTRSDAAWTVTSVTATTGSLFVLSKGSSKKAVHCKMDSRGRITIPKVFRGMFKDVKNVVLCGSVHYVEIRRK